MRWFALVAMLGACRFTPGQQSGDDRSDGAPGPDSDAKIYLDAATVCPPSYTVTLPRSASHYLITTTAKTFWNHHASCTSATTHLAVLDTVGERDALETTLQAIGTPPPQDRYYVGAVQTALQTDVKAGWIDFAGAPVAATQWYGAEPGDASDNNELNHDEQLAVIDSVLMGLLDVKGTVLYGAVCECDGAVIAATAATAIALDPNHP